MKSQKFLLFLLLLWLSPRSKADDLPIIPQPNQVEIRTGKFDTSQITEIKTFGVSEDTKNQFADYLTANGFLIRSRIKTKTRDAELIFLIDKKVENNEGYILDIEKNKIQLTASTEIGLFYGVQTLVQLIEHLSYIPCSKIVDEPRFTYRGLHLDVSRHFYSTNFIKKQLDMMAYFKLNRFHWHLTDGPGWRLEIKKYPLLTNIAAWRTHALWKDWWATTPRKYVHKDSIDKAFGGFYTQAEAREIVRYAAKRNIEVIPEIEMPGHSEEVLAVYPEFACSRKPYTQSEFCVGNDSTFLFLENVLLEVMDIFPSKYIHIGGDEADKSHWKTCLKCQKRIKDENLKNEDELQSYLIKRIEKFLLSHDRCLLGWDEILEGGLAAKATVMSWRGETGGIKAAKQGNDVIMTPNSYCYFDAYQATPSTQPEAIGGFLPLEKVYSYNPISRELSRNEQKHIIGVQANVWTEYIPTEIHSEYMMYPRLLALAEVAWTKPQRKEWNDFKKRISLAIPKLQQKGINTFTLSNKVEFAHHRDIINEAIAVTLSSEKYGTDIRYTLDGTMPNQQSAIYSRPILIKDSAAISAQLFAENEPLGEVKKVRFDYHKAIGKSVFYHTPINHYYPAKGNITLIDGEKGGLTHRDGRWQGFMTNGMDITIDLGEEQNITSVQTNFMQNKGAWIYFPKSVKISISSDNIHFFEIATIPTTIDKDATGTLFQVFEWRGEAQGRYIRYTAQPNSIEGSWVFADEVIVW